jgi:hypothetical protein
VELQYGKDFLPCRVIAFFQHPDSNIAMALILPCRPWMKINENQSSTIIEHWNVQCEQRVYEKQSDGSLREVLITEEECDRRLRPNEVFRYVPMYHIIEATKIRQVIFGIQENGPLSDCWKEDEGNLLIVSDRVNSWGNEFEDFTDS